MYRNDDEEQAYYDDLQTDIPTEKPKKEKKAPVKKAPAKKATPRKRRGGFSNKDLSFDSDED